jgi:hypothetical protein
MGLAASPRGDNVRVSPPAPAVECDVLMRLVTDVDLLPVTARLAYDTSDPFAVRMALRSPGGPEVEWVMSRDLLAGGLSHPSGDGDVGVWPSTAAGEEVLCLSLASPDGQALLVGDTAEVSGFVARTYDAVPPGEEGDFLDLDALVEQLLASAPDQ